TGRFGQAERVEAAAQSSQLAQAVAGVRSDGGRGYALVGEPLRALTPDEVAQLEANGNTADDWGRVRVVDGFDPGRVRCCSFAGEVQLGRFRSAVDVGDGVRLPAGLVRATLCHCVVGHEALIRNTDLLASCVVGS